MEELEKVIKFREAWPDTEYLLGVNDVSEIEEGTLFGLVFSEDDLYNIAPETDFNDTGDLIYQFDDLIIEEAGIEVNSSVISDNLPFIFKKLNGNLAQELLSGEIFVLSGKDANGLTAPLTATEFQNALSKYSKYNVLIYCGATEWRTEKYIPDTFFKITDGFKSLYGYQTLPHKDEIIGAFKSITEQSRKIFAAEFKKCVGDAQSIAETENLIFDVEHVKPKTM